MRILDTIMIIGFTALAILTYLNVIAYSTLIGMI